jgi:hypothetical protein
MPGNNNPTGMTMSDDRQAALARLYQQPMPTATRARLAAALLHGVPCTDAQRAEAGQAVEVHVIEALADLVDDYREALRDHKRPPSVLLRDARGLIKQIEAMQDGDQPREFEISRVLEAALFVESERRNLPFAWVERQRFSAERARQVLLPLLQSFIADPPPSFRNQRGQRGAGVLSKAAASDRLQAVLARAYARIMGPMGDADAAADRVVDAIALVADDAQAARNATAHDHDLALVFARAKDVRERRACTAERLKRKTTETRDQP